MRRLASALALTVAIGAVLASSAGAAETQVLIQGFEYRPSAVEVDVGDVVAWTNVDGTAHTVTADDGTFDSGRMGEGARFAIMFSQPGTYAYHCDLHDHTGTVTVRGAAPPTTDTTTSTAPPTTTTTAAAAPASTTPPPPAAPGASSTTASSTPTAVTQDAAAAQPSAGATTSSVTASAAFAVVSAPLIPAPDPLGWPAVVAILVLVAVLASQLSLAAPDVVTRRLRLVAAALTAVTSAVHLQLRFELDYPEPTATFFLLHAVAAAGVAAVLVASTARIGVWLGAAFHVASLVAFAVSRSMGLFGFHESGFDPSPQAAVAVAAECAALGVLGVVALRIVRHSVAWRPS